MSREQVKDAIRRKDLIIHYIADGSPCKCCGDDNENIFRDHYMDAHTHGAFDLCGYELQLTSIFSGRDTTYILNEFIAYFSDHKDDLKANAESGTLFCLPGSFIGIDDFSFSGLYVEEMKTRNNNGFIGIRIKVDRTPKGEFSSDMRSPYIRATLS